MHLFADLQLEPTLGKEHGGYGNNNASECLLLFAFSQGIQNGITRRCQTLPICTTHFTGYLTDVGTLLGWCARDGVTGEKFLKARRIFTNYSICLAAKLPDHDHLPCL